jgi:hypothetical protein
VDKETNNKLPSTVKRGILNFLHVDWARFTTVRAERLSIMMVKRKRIP